MGSMISDWKERRRAKQGGMMAARTEPVTGLAVPAAQPMQSPYVDARREWNERYGSYISRARTWQIVALSAIGLCAVMAYGLVDMAKSSRVEPYIVEVDKLGQAVAVRPAEVAGKPDQRIVRFQLANYITNARSVTPDRVVQKKWLDSVYAVSSGSAAAFLNDYYKANDPFNKGRTSLVSVELQNAPLPLSDTTWQVQWTETTRGLNGLVENVTRYQAILTVSTFEPTTAQQIIANPTGTVIDQISWASQL